VGFALSSESHFPLGQQSIGRMMESMGVWLLGSAIVLRSLGSEMPPPSFFMAARDVDRDGALQPERLR
jgi:hypothetical protein